MLKILDDRLELLPSVHISSLCVLFYFFFKSKGIHNYQKLPKCIKDLPTIFHLHVHVVSLTTPFFRDCFSMVQVGVWFLVGPFVYFHTSCVRTVKALARLCGCAVSLEPSLVPYLIHTCISTIISWAGSNMFYWPWALTLKNEFWL